MWLLKQPYVGTVIFPLITASIISFIRNPKFYNFVQRAISILICCIAIFVGVQIWNFVIKIGNVEIDNTRTSSGFLASGIMNGIPKENIEEDSNEKDNLTEETNEEKNITVGQAIKCLCDSIKKDPKAVFEVYISNYLATISIYPIDFDEMKIIVQKQFDWTNTEEIRKIGYKIYEYGEENVFYLLETVSRYAEEYKSINKPITIVNKIITSLIFCQFNLFIFTRFITIIFGYIIVKNIKL